MKNIFDIPVSYYRNYRDNEGVTITLHDILNTRRAEHLQTLEKVRSATTDDEKNRLKKQLPLFTPSAHLVNRKAEASLTDKLVSHTGFMQFDIDLKDNPAMNPCQVRDAMAVIPFVAYVALSASGRGVWGLVRIERPAELARYYQHFRRVVESKTGIKLDSTKGSNETDLRYISHDHEARFNYNAVALPLPEPGKAKPKARPAVIRRFAVQPWHGQVQPGDSLADVEILVSEVVAGGLSANFLHDYKTYFAVGSAFARELGERGREMFHAICQAHPKYNDRETDGHFNEWLRYPNNSGHLGTFFNICKQHGLYTYDPKLNHYNDRKNSPKKLLKNPTREEVALLSPKPDAEVISRQEPAPIPRPEEAIKPPKPATNPLDAPEPSMSLNITSENSRSIFNTLLADLDRGKPWELIYQQNVKVLPKDITPEKVKSHFNMIAKEIKAEVTNKGKYKFIQARFHAGYTLFGIADHFSFLGFADERKVKEFLSFRESLATA